MSEIFPDKFTPTERTVAGQAAVLLRILGARSLSVGQLFVEYRDEDSLATYDSFALALTLLYGAGVLDFQDEIVRAH